MKRGTWQCSDGRQHGVDCMEAALERGDQTWV